MPLEQTITIVNNSGKIISTGKQLVSIFKEAKASYQEKKAQIKNERSRQRAKTFAPSRSVQQHAEYYGESDEEDQPYQQSHGKTRSRHHEYEDIHHRDWEPRRRSYDYAHSVASSRRSHSHRHHKSSHSRHHGEGSNKARSVALTEKNLKTLSEASSTKPSRGPVQYRTPYAETLPLGQSHMDLTTVDPRNDPRTEIVPRRRSESELRVARRTKEIDMNLAYGEIPPDLESRVDLDPARQSEASAKTLVRKVEMLLDEAHCVQHSATSMIKHLQEKPESAAAVALTLSELSKVVAKMSPAVLGMLKGSSPAVFSLLASPQFLIGTGVAVGITVVMFGGWKIVQQVKEQQAAREALAYQGMPMARPAPLRTQSAYANSYDEALVVDDELSVIESWRRGIEPFGDEESADLELITPEADRATRADARENRDDDFDVRSHRSTKTHRTSKTSKTSRTSKTSKTTKTNKTEKLHKSNKSRISDDEVPERRSSKSSSASVRGGPKSAIVGPSKSKGKEVKAIEASRSSARGDLELAMRPKVQRQQSDMFKSIFKHKKEKESSSSSHKDLVLA